MAIEVAIRTLRETEGPMNIKSSGQNLLSYKIKESSVYYERMFGSTKKLAIVGAFSAHVCATGAAVVASETSPDRATTYQNPTHTAQNSAQHRAARLLRVHNEERRRLGLRALRWNRELERDAKQWAHHLSRRGMLQHADYRTLENTGENLWMGTSGRWPVESMVGAFISEKRHYRHGTFPDISHTGNWADVGHYTQIVWRETQEVGCALATARGNDVLVCRYWPAGNVVGRRAF